MKPTNEALKNYQLSDISYDKGANIAKATFTEDLSSSDKASLKGIIVDIFGVKPGWVGQNGLVLSIPEKKFNDFQKLLIIDLQMTLADEEVATESQKQSSVTPVKGVMESFSSSLRKSLITEAKDIDDNDIMEGDEVLVVGRTDHEGKKGIIVETSDRSDFVIVEIKGKNYSYHASDLKKIDEEEEEDEPDYDEDEMNTYEYVIDLDERGDFKAHVEDYEGDTVFEIDGMDDLMSIIDDGFMKDKDDTDGLLKHLQEIGELGKDAILENLDTKIDKFIAAINEDMGDDDALSLDNSEPEYEVTVATEEPRDIQTAYKVAQKLGIEGSPDTGFIVATKVLLRKFVNTLKGFDLLVSKILDAHNNEVALATIEPYKPVGRPTNKYNYPNRMRESKAGVPNAGPKESHLSDDFEGEVLYQTPNGKYSVEIAKTKGSGGPKKELVVVTDQMYTDWVMVYDDGSVAYDAPERIPQKVKDVVAKAAKTHFDELTAHRNVTNEGKLVHEAYTFDQAKADFESDGRAHFHGSDDEEMKVFYAMIDYLKEQGIEYGETNITPEQYTLYDLSKFDSNLRRIKK